MNRRTIHRANKTRDCGTYRCRQKIERGTLYIRHKYFPGDDGWEDGTVPTTIEQCSGCADGDLEYIRTHYGVPAHLGMVFVDGTRTGIIGGAFDQYLCVFFKGEKQPVPFHPTDHIVYEEGQARTTRPGRPRGIVTVELVGVS